ncbi:MAG: ribosome maturation factor RimM [Anaerovoracaceae bacterium]|jgi:16S rRNA processing protein RimM
MKKLKLGKITGAVGLKGEIKVYPYTDYKEKFEELPYILCDDVKYPITRVRYIKNMVVLKLEGIDDRNEAEASAGKYLYIYKMDAPPLQDGAYYIHELVGLTVEEEGGGVLGHLSDVIQNAAQDIYEVETHEGKTILIPAVEEFVKDIDLENSRMMVKLIPGMKE